MEHRFACIPRLGADRPRLSVADVWLRKGIGLRYFVLPFLLNICLIWLFLLIKDFSPVNYRVFRLYGAICGCFSTSGNMLSLPTVNNFMSCHRFNLTCCRKITHFPVTQSIVYTTIYFQSTAALRTAFSMFLSYIVWLFRTMPLLSAPEIVPTSMYNSCRKAARDIPDGLFFFQFM